MAQLSSTSIYGNLTVNANTTLSQTIINYTATIGPSVLITGQRNTSLTDHGLLVLGDLDSYNMSLDRNSIQARNNGSIANLYIQNALGHISLGVAGNADYSTYINSTKVSTSTTTGALVVSGGVGIVGALNVGGTITSTASIGFKVAPTSGEARIGIQAVTDQWKYVRLAGTSGAVKWDIATKENDLSGALQFRPIGSPTNEVYITTGGQLNVTANIASSSKDSGALVITEGGLGVDGSIHAGGNVIADVRIGINTPSEPVTYFQINGTTNASLTNHGLMVLGLTTGTSIAISRSQIQARDGVNASNLNLNISGGHIYLGVDSATYTTSVRGSKVSTSTTTGALTVLGGVGIVGALNVGGTITAPNFTGLASTATWADTVDVNASDSGSGEFKLVWNSGDTIYSTAGVTLNRDEKRITATSFKGRAVNIYYRGGSSLQYTHIRTGTWNSDDDDDQDVTFPNAFPNACYHVHTNMSSSTIVTMSKTGFTINRDNTIDGAYGSTYLAFGY